MKNLRLWEYFIAVAEERHFGRAAARLHIAQPPLSRQIQQLEQSLGVRLLYRTNRQVELTPAGVVFLDHARRVLADAARAVQEAQATARGEAGCLRMGFVSSASHRVLPQLQQVFRARYPQVRISLAVGTSLEQITMLQNDQLDVGLVRSVGLPDTFQTRRVEAAPLAAILPPEDPLALRDRLTLSDFAGRPLLLYPRVDNPTIYDGIVAHCRNAGFEPEVVQEANETVVAGLVGAGLGLALVIGTDYPTPPGGPIVRPLEPPVPRWDLVLAWNQETPLVANLAGIVEATALGHIPKNN